MNAQSLYQTFQRYRSLRTHKISLLPVVILMPHSACNCRCVMCDIWKGNQQLKQLQETDIQSLLSALRKYKTRQVLMSGGEALLNPLFFRFCEILKQERIRITLLSTGLSLAKHAEQVCQWVDDVIVSLDGDNVLHDEIRNIPGAYQKLNNGVKCLRVNNAAFKISGRTVIHRLNFRKWPLIIESAASMGLDSISFLPADTTSEAFNRETPWGPARQQEILPGRHELPEMQSIIDSIISQYAIEFASGFIVESPQKMQMIHDYYAAQHGLMPFPVKKCNAPWVSSVIEADGAVRPCFFHRPYGNIRSNGLEAILNAETAVSFRKNLDMNKDETCKKCVCYLHLSPTTHLAG